MDCQTCKHWSGTKHSKWGDCGTWIFTVDAMNHNDRFGNVCAPPLDPHDMQYYLSSSRIKKSFTFVENMLKGNTKVRLLRVRREVLWMDDHGVQTKTKRFVPFIQTRKDMECELYEATKNCQM